LYIYIGPTGEAKRLIVDWQCPTEPQITGADAAFHFYIGPERRRSKAIDTGSEASSRAQAGVNIKSDENGQKRLCSF